MTHCAFESAEPKGIVMEPHESAQSQPKWGPFTGRQLTAMACVAIFLLVVIVPTAALAGAGAFTSSTGPAVKATNSSASTGAKAVEAVESNTGTATRYGVHGSALGSGGIGVGGAGAKYGVFSYGNLGIRAGNKLACTACVPKNALGPDVMTAMAAQKPYKIDFAMPFSDMIGDDLSPRIPIGSGVYLQAYCAWNQTFIQLGAVPDSNGFTIGGVAFTGNTATQRDEAGLNSIMLTKANPTGPIHI
jgi:hypothetical protein